jgi:hypothetical protein
MSPRAPDDPRTDDPRLGEARQRADALAHQVGATLAGLGDRVPEDLHARAKALIVDTEKALSNDAPRERLRLLASRLEELRRVLPAVAGGEGSELRGGASG